MKIKGRFLNKQHRY